MSTVLVIGAGPNIGLAVAKTFAGAGYKVALASRSKATDLYTHFTFDASKPETVPQLFEGVRKDLGDPKVVVYNAAARTATPDNPFSLTLEQFQSDFNVNAASVYAAAKEAVDGFARTGPGSTFIFTGNKLNVWGQPQTLAFGMGKSATAHLARAGSKSFEGKGYKFYYVDQRQSDGGITFPTGTEAHANTFLELAHDDKQRAWHYTFVDGKGYVDFQER
ncbi:short-chain dehydrogenase [Seiridium cupressi]